MGRPNRIALNLQLRLLTAFAMASELSVSAQTTLPPTAPTSITASQLPSANPSITTPTATHGSMNISWDGHTLQVDANDVGLNALLRSLATRTGTRMVGSVPEDRIFGTYGPGPLISVLSELLDGVAVNVLFLDHVGTKPAELTLTARIGGPSGPMAQQPQTPPQQDVAGPTSAPGGAGSPASPGQSPARFQNGPQGQSSQAYGSENTAPSDAPTTSNATGTPTSPNGVKTPEEIFEQLQRLRATAQTNR